MTEPAPLAVLDIDGVLADVRHRVHHVARRPKDWDAFFAGAPADPPLPEGVALAERYAAEGLVVVYLTGRPERCRRDTLGWLERHGLPAGDLHMRGDRDRRPARFTKLATLRRLGATAPIVAVVDDDVAVVDLLRDNGYPVIHATWMAGGTLGVDGPPAAGTPAAGSLPQTSDPVQQVLLEAQESDGRT